MDLESAAKVLGVHYQTAYRWVRSGLLPAVRTASGYELRPEDVERVAAERRSVNRPRTTESPVLDWDSERERFVAALAAGDETAARSVIGDLIATGAGAVEICEFLIAPGLRDLRRGASPIGAVLAGEAARATSICEHLVTSLASPPRGRPRGVAVVASPEGEVGGVSSLMVTAALRAERWRVHHLGADVPTAELAEFVRDCEADAVILALAAACDAAEEAREKLLAVVGVPVLLQVGGDALSQLVEDLVAAVRPAGGHRAEGA